MPKQSITTISTSSNSKSIVIYLNPDQEKKIIVKQNKGKSGVYS